MFRYNPERRSNRSRGGRCANLQQKKNNMPLCSTTEPSQQAFQHWWQKNGDWVEEPNVRRGGESGVQRLLDQSGVLYAKKQVGHIYRSLLYPQGRPTVLRERRAGAPQWVGEDVGTL